MKSSTRTLILAAAFALAFLTPASAETKTLHYPTQDDALFSIEVPSDWKVTEIEEVGDFGTLESPNGNVLQFRAQKFETEDEAKEEIDAIADETAKFLEETYKEVKLGEAEELTGAYPGAKLGGTGKDKDGDEYEFISAMLVIGPTTVAEIWGAVSPEDKEDMAAANKILASFKAAK